MDTTPAVMQVTAELEAALRSAVAKVLAEQKRRLEENLVAERARADAAKQLLGAALEILDRVDEGALSREDWRRARLIRHAAHATLPPEVIAQVERDRERLRRGEPLEEALPPAEFFQEVRRLAGEA